MDYTSARRHSRLTTNYRALRHGRTESSPTWATEIHGRYILSRENKATGIRRGGTWKRNDLTTKGMKRKTVFAYPAMTTPSWECTSHKTASGMCSSSLTAPLRFWVRKRGCGLYYPWGRWDTQHFPSTNTSQWVFTACTVFWFTWTFKRTKTTTKMLSYEHLRVTTHMNSTELEGTGMRGVLSLSPRGLQDIKEAWDTKTTTHRRPVVPEEKVLNDILPVNSPYEQPSE